MNTQFYIVVNVKTVKGIQSYGKFFIGNDKDVAYDIFKKLTGDADVNEKNVLFMELMETKQGLPINIEMISCTLDELTSNCKLITREIFKLFNLHELND